MNLVSMNFAAAVGAASLLTALATAVFACAGATVGLRARRPMLVRAARRALLVTALLTSMAMATLGVALLRNDFSLAYVAGVSSRAMEPYMKWASIYSQQAGSLLFWTWAMSLFVAAFAWFTLPRIPWGAPHAIAVCGATVAAFLIPLVFLASPFHVSIVTPPDGRGLNPLLVDAGMLVHPPFLLSGLVSTVVPFALGAAALMSARIDGAWIAAVRRWAVLSWLVLSIGNFLGGWWAYHVLGWGGYWGWDPVENSAILPLFPMTAFVHSMMVQERRGMLKLWNLVLVVAAFGLAVFGTFNVRSGLVDSVHSFAQSQIGAYFLVLVGIVLVASMALMAWRAPYLRAEHDFESLLSRESALIVNNYLFTAIALVILGGTLFPVFSELFANTRVTVGPSFFNAAVGPLLVVLVAWIAIGTVLPWRQASNATLVHRFIPPLGGAIGCAIALWILGMRDALALIVTSSAIALAIATVREFALGARGLRAATGRPWVGALLSLFERDQRRYGGYLVHLGVAVMAVAVVGSTIYQQQLRPTLNPGESFEVAGRTVTYNGLLQRKGIANGIDSEIFAELVVTQGGEQVGLLEPARRLFTNFPGQPTTVVGLQSTWRDDLYVFLQGWDDSEAVELHVFVNPLVNWLWIGGAVYILGGVLAWAPRGVPERARVALPAAAGSQA